MNTNTIKKLTLFINICTLIVLTVTLYIQNTGNNFLSSIFDNTTPPQWDVYYNAMFEGDIAKAEWSNTQDNTLYIYYKEGRIVTAHVNTIVPVNLPH